MYVSSKYENSYFQFGWFIFVDRLGSEDVQSFSAIIQLVEAHYRHSCTKTWVTVDHDAKISPSSPPIMLDTDKS